MFSGRFEAQAVKSEYVADRMAQVRPLARLGPVSRAHSVRAVAASSFGRLGRLVLVTPKRSTGHNSADNYVHT